MHLVSCAPPQEPLEAAPRTALLADPIDGEEWDGYWSADVYFVRHTTASGEVAWYRLADDETVGSQPRDARVLALRTTPRDRITVVIAQSPGGRRMLVGSAGRSRR